MTHWTELAEVARDNRADESKAESLAEGTMKVQ